MFKVSPEIVAVLQKLRLAQWFHPSEDQKMREVEEFMNAGTQKMAQEFYITFIGSPLHRLQKEIDEFTKLNNGVAPKLVHVGPQLREELCRMWAGEDLGSPARDNLFRVGIAAAHPKLNGIPAQWHPVLKIVGGKTWEAMTPEEQVAAKAEAKARDVFSLE